MAASAVTRTKTSHGKVGSSRRAIMKIASAPSSMPEAMRFMRFISARRTSSVRGLALGIGAVTLISTHGTHHPAMPFDHRAAAQVTLRVDDRLPERISRLLLLLRLHLGFFIVFSHEIFPPRTVAG